MSCEKNTEPTPETTAESGQTAPETQAPQQETSGEDAVPQSPAAEAAPEKAAEAAPAKSEAEQLREELAAEKDRALRLAAEYDNYRRRSVRERESIYADVKVDTLLKILPIYDNLERALQQETADEAYRRGVELTLKQFDEALAKLGVKPVPSVGEHFDPKLHNAVMHTEDPQKGEGEIVAEFQKGFLMGERVIRFSMVQVAN